MAFKDKFVDFQNLDVNENISLRQADPDKDLENYYQMFSNANIFKYYGGGGKGKTTYDGVKRILANQINEFEKARIYSWVIAVKDSDEAIGRILLSNFEENNKIANIGYFINEKYWGQGIISACIKPVVEFGFSYLELERIYTKVHTENPASWKALEKNGFTREGHMRHCFQIYSGLSDCFIYSRLYSDL